MDKPIALTIEKYIDGKNVGDKVYLPIATNQDEYRSQVWKLQAYLPYGAWSEASTESSLYSAYKDQGINIPYEWRDSYSSYVGD